MGLAFYFKNVYNGDRPAHRNTNQGGWQSTERSFIIMKKIGIIGAMDVEVERLKADMTVTWQITKAQMHFCEGTLKNQQVVVVRSGIGKVNAAVCTQILVDEFGVDAVINTGETIRRIWTPDMKIACCVINEHAVGLFESQIYTVRVSSNSFVGAGVRQQSGHVGPDTTMRLFNQI